MTLGRCSSTSAINGCHHRCTSFPGKGNQPLSLNHLPPILTNIMNQHDSATFYLITNTNMLGTSCHQLVVNPAVTLWPTCSINPADNLNQHHQHDQCSAAETCWAQALSLRRKLTGTYRSRGWATRAWSRWVVGTVSSQRWRIPMVRWAGIPMVPSWMRTYEKCPAAM